MALVHFFAHCCVCRLQPVAHATAPRRHTHTPLWARARARMPTTTLVSGIFIYSSLILGFAGRPLARAPPHTPVPAHAHDTRPRQMRTRQHAPAHTRPRPHVPRPGSAEGTWVAVAGSGLCMPSMLAAQWGTCLHLPSPMPLLMWQGATQQAACPTQPRHADPT